MSFFKKLVDSIQQFEIIIIHRHNNADPDALGSQLGLAELIRQNYQKTVYCVGQNTTSLSFIGQMDIITDDIYEQALVIIVDTANTPRIDDKRYHLGQQLIKIDHHPNVDQYGDLMYIDESASSTSEIIASFAKDYALYMTPTIARLLYIGIIGDTGRFLYESTTQKTMEIVTFLRGFKFSATQANYELITNPLAVHQLKGYVLQHLKVNQKSVAYVIITQKVLQKYQLTDEHTAAIVSSPGEVEGVICWGIFVEQLAGHYRCRLRSKGPSINQIATQFHGGGHPLASGANAKDKKEVQQIIRQLTKVSYQYQKLGDTQ